MKIKICGLKSAKDILLANKYLPDYAGFVFAPSKRQVSAPQAREFRQMLERRIKTVGVFVDEDIQNVLALVREKIIDIAQLHGRENQAYINALTAAGAPVIKAISVGENFVLPDVKADYVLFDSGAGGTGQTFNWQKIKGYKNPFFLAGGLNASNIKEAMKLNPFCLDINSGVETNGVKDEAKIKQIFSIIKGE